MEKVENPWGNAPEGLALPGYYRKGAVACGLLLVPTVWALMHCSDIATQAGMQPDDFGTPLVALAIALGFAGLALLMGRVASAIVAIVLFMSVGAAPMSGMNGMRAAVHRYDPSDVYPAFVSARPSAFDQEMKRQGEGIQELTTEFMRGVQGVIAGKGPGSYIVSNVPYESPVLGALKDGAGATTGRKVSAPVAGDAPEVFPMPDWSRPN